MDPKIRKLNAEKEKNLAKIAELMARNEEIDARVTELENLDIVGLVREHHVTPEELARLLATLTDRPAPKEKTEEK